MFQAPDTDTDVQSQGFTAPETDSAPPQWSDALKNIGPDAMATAKSLSTPFPINAINTVKDLASTGSGMGALKKAVEPITNLASKDVWIQHPVGNTVTAAGLLAGGLAGGAEGAPGGAANSVGEGLSNVGGRMASDLAETSGNTVKKINPEALGADAQENIRTVGENEKPNLADVRAESGKKLVNEGVVGGLGQDIGDRLQAASEKVDAFGKQVKSAINAVKSKGVDAAVDAKTVLDPLLQKWAELGDSSVPAMARPFGDLYTRLENMANKNGGKLSFEDIDGELHDPGLKEAFKKGPDSRAYETARTKYAVLAGARDDVVGQIAKQAGDPQVASNLLEANKGYSYYSKIAKDMESPAAAGAGNGPPSPQRAALRGSPIRAGVYATIQSVKPAIAKALIRGGDFAAKYGPIIEGAAKRGTQSLLMTDFLLKQKDPNYAEATK